MRDRSPVQIALPGSARITAIIRNGKILDPADVTRLEAGDYVHILVESGEVEHLNQLFTSIEYVAAHDFFGDFILDADALLGDIASLYGFTVSPQKADKTIGIYLSELFHKKPVVGDFAKFENVELVVREIEKGQITKVGLKLRH